MLLRVWQVNTYQEAIKAISILCVLFLLHPSEVLELLSTFSGKANSKLRRHQQVAQPGPLLHTKLADSVGNQ